MGFPLSCPAGVCTNPQEAHGEGRGWGGVAKPPLTWTREYGEEVCGDREELGVEPRNGAGLGTPKDLSLKKFASPPLTLTLFLGLSFFPFPFREGGSWSTPSSTPRAQL